MTIIPSLYKRIYPFQCRYIPIDDSTITFGLFYKSRSKRIDDLINKLKTIAEEIIEGENEH